MTGAAAPTLLVVAGEASGDLHGAEILRELKARHPGVRVVGVGGARMTPLLDRKLADVKELAVVGFVEPLVKLPALWALKRRILQAAKEEGVRHVLTIDYPGFNFMLGAALKEAIPGLQLHHYVCPQVWAWKRGRIPKMGRLLDTLYCLFDFEPALFEGYPVHAHWVGNPLVEAVHPEVDRAVFFAETGLDPHRPLVALLPGSRRGELDRLLPPMLDLVARWRAEHPLVQWVLPVASTLSEADVAARVAELPVVLVGPQRTYAARAYADAALVASGTATLETALLGTPFAIVYKLQPLTYAMAKRVVKLPYFGLANVVAGRKVVQELVQGDVTAERLSPVLESLLDPSAAMDLRSELATLKAKLGEPGAAARVAEHVILKLR